MSILCRVFTHAAIPSRLWNGGYYFSKCARCECDLIRRGSQWTEVPKGYQVVWREVEGPPVDWTPWSADKRRDDPSITEILSPVGPAHIAPAAAKLVVGPADAAEAPAHHQRRVA